MPFGAADLPGLLTSVLERRAYGFSLVVKGLGLGGWVGGQGSGLGTWGLGLGAWGLELALSHCALSRARALVGTGSARPHCTQKQS